MFIVAVRVITFLFGWSGRPTVGSRVLPASTGDPSDGRLTKDFTVVGDAGAVFQTYLRLAPDRLEKLRDYVEKRLAELMQEMGLAADGTVDGASWMGNRQRFQAIYDRELSFRRGMDGGSSVFKDSNLSFGTGIRFVRDMSAKLSDEMVGTKPFFTAVKKRPNGAPMAKAIEELIQLELDGTNIQDEIRMAQRVACIRNEAVVKVKYVLDSTPYVGPATVMVDPKTGIPIATPNGYMIYADDDFLPAPDNPNPGQPTWFVLKKDPLFRMQKGQFPYRRIDRLPQTLDHFEGVELSTVDYRSFLCPLDAPDIHKADMVAQLFTDTQEHLAETYQGFEQYADYCTRVALAGEDQPKASHGERDGRKVSSVVKKRNMAEIYLRIDADGDNMQEDVMVIYDRDNQGIVFYEYMANQTGKRPFEVIVGVERVENRWYGRGVIDFLEDLDKYIDVQFNRLNLKDSRNNSATFYEPNACQTWKAGAKPEFGTDEIYKLEPGFDRDNRPPLFRINLDEKSELAQELMKEAQQQISLLFGMVSAQDASSTNLNNSRTATGIINIERTGNTLSRYALQEQKRGVTAILAQCMTVAIENLHDLELLLDPNGEMLFSINKDEARSIEKEVTLLLTRSRSTEMLSSNQQALAIVQGYHALRKTDPEQLLHTRTFYLQMLKALEVGDPEEACPPVTKEEVQEFQQAQAAAQQKALTHQMRETINIKDVPPSVAMQMEGQAGLKPASLEEHQRHLDIMHPPKTQPQPSPEAPP